MARSICSSLLVTASFWPWFVVPGFEPLCCDPTVDEAGEAEPRFVSVLPCMAGFVVPEMAPEWFAELAPFDAGFVIAGLGQA